MNANMVAAGAQAILAGYLAFTLRRGARTAPRRRLARGLGSFAIYAVLLAAVFALPDPWASACNAGCLVFAAYSTIDVLSYVVWLARGAAPDVPSRLPHHLGAVAFAAGSAGGAAALASLDAPARLDAAFTGQLLVLLLLLLAAFVGAALASTRRVPGGTAMLVACAWPMLTTVLNLSSHVGLSPVDEGTYLLVRDLAILVYGLSLMVAYLDHGHEPMSLESRLVASALTLVLGTGTVAVHLLAPYAASIAYDFEAATRAESEVAERVLGFMVASSVAVIALVPRLFRRSVLDPIERLATGLSRVEAGELGKVEVHRQDELGRLTRSFNTMVDALGTQMTALETLNAELRHQVAARSRQIAEVLARFEPGEAGLEQGAVIGGRYHVEGRLGAGGMGIVYAVSRTGDPRALAMKVMASHVSRDEGVRFAREAEIAATLDDPRLVGVVDVGVHQGRAFLVMERIEGGSLEDARPRFGDATWALPLLAQIAGGIAALHARGIVHRDLKPANVLLDVRAGVTTAKITDFGIAKRDVVDVLGATAAIDATSDEAGDAAGTGAAPTTAGVALGTLAYMAPELARGTGSAAPARDMFAFGVLAYELLEGKNPFAVPPVLDVLGGRAAEPPPHRPRATPAHIGPLLLACLAADPAARPTAPDVDAAFAR